MIECWLVVGELGISRVFSCSVTEVKRPESLSLSVEFLTSSSTADEFAETGFPETCERDLVEALRDALAARGEELVAVRARFDERAGCLLWRVRAMAVVADRWYQASPPLLLWTGLGKYSQGAKSSENTKREKDKHTNRKRRDATRASRRHPCTGHLISSQLHGAANWRALARR